MQNLWISIAYLHEEDDGRRNVKHAKAITKLLYMPVTLYAGHDYIADIREEDDGRSNVKHARAIALYAMIV